MFPGFATLFKDNENKVHLFFFPGINENGSFIYHDIGDIDDEYDIKNHDDGSKEFIFKRKGLKKIICKFIKDDNSIDYFTFTI